MITARQVGAILSEDELPLRRDELRDHVIVRDDGSILVVLFGSATQRQALDLLRPHMVGCVAEPFGGFHVVVREAR